FSEQMVKQPITSRVILELGVPISIIAARVDSQGGEIIVEVSGAHVDKVIPAFRDKGVIVTTSRPVAVDDKRCFDCGACVSLCPVNAIELTEDFSVVFDAEKCIGTYCSLCIDSCPARAITLSKTTEHDSAN
ncbi:unnamed protein product, partial [marine sediment metagenome]